MKETLFVLFLTLGGEPIEWTPHFSLKDCLSIKRKIDRLSKSGHLYSCKKETVTLEQNGDKYVIVDFINE